MNRRLAFALFAACLATPAAAAEGDIRGLVFAPRDLIFATRGLDFAARDLVLTPRNLVYAPRDLVLAPREIVFKVEGLYRIVETKKDIAIELPADILFDFDKSNFQPSAAYALKDAALILRQQAKGTVRIEGYTDAKGAPDYNEKLSTARAKSVEQWLVEQGGLTKMRFASKGFGAAKPVAPSSHPDGTDNPEGRQLNRRVVIVFSKS